MAVPRFLLRKLYKRGSLRETADGCFAFSLQNPLGSATLTGPPRIVVNGVAFPADRVDAGRIDVAGISEETPHVFAKGDTVDLKFPGRLLRGGNRIHVRIPTKEFGMLELLIEEREAEYCEIRPGVDAGDAPDSRANG